MFEGLAPYWKIVMFLRKVAIEIWASIGLSKQGRFMFINVNNGDDLSYVFKNGGHWDLSIDLPRKIYVQRRWFKLRGSQVF